MTIERIVDYVMHTPMNTNRAVLISMLKELLRTGGYDPDTPENPDIPTGDIIYDGGVEK